MHAFRPVVWIIRPVQGVIEVYRYTRSMRSQAFGGERRRLGKQFGRKQLRQAGQTVDTTGVRGDLNCVPGARYD